MKSSIVSFHTPRHLSSPGRRGRKTETAADAQILFLNKVDVLANKLKDPSQQIAINFPDYTGQNGSSTDAIEFFKKKFFTLNRNPEKQIYAYPTTATNSENIKVSAMPGQGCCEAHARGGPGR